MAKGTAATAPAQPSAPGRPGLAPPLLLSLLVLAGAAQAAPPGDPARGEAVYERCQGCHSLARNRTGPKHCGLLGRKAGSVAGYAYSKALADSGIVWTPESLDRFLEAPFETVPGTRMGYAGVKDSQERADLVAFLTAVGPCRE